MCLMAREVKVLDPSLLPSFTTIQCEINLDDNVNENGLNKEGQDAL